MKMKKLLAAALAATMMLSSMVTSVVASAEETPAIPVAVTIEEIEVGATDYTANFDITFDPAVAGPHLLFDVDATGTLTNIVVENEDLKIYTDEGGTNLSDGMFLVEPKGTDKAVSAVNLTATFALEPAAKANDEIQVDVVVTDNADWDENTLVFAAGSATYTVEAPHECTAGEVTPNNDGTHDIACAGCELLFADNEPCSYVDGVCSVCGYEEPVTGPTVDTNIVPTASIIISDTLGAGIFVKNALVSSYDHYTMEISQTRYDDDCNEYVADTIIVKDTELTAAGSTQKYYRFMGVQMFGLALDIKVVIKCYDANENLVAVSEDWHTTIAQLAIAQYNSTSKATTKTLMSDLLVMGAEAEKYFAGRKTSSKLAERVNNGELCNAGFVGTPSAALGTLNTTTSTVYGDSGITNTLTTAVSLGGSPSVGYVFKNTGLDKANLRMELSYHSDYKDADITDTVTADMWSTSGSYFTYSFSKTCMYDSNKTVTAKIYYNDELVLTNQYSVETYISNTKTTSSAYNLCVAIGKFGAAARAYFGTT